LHVSGLLRYPIPQVAVPEPTRAAA
jgi:hypothetical protein